MLEEWGPLLTFPVVAIGIFFAFFAAWFWSLGHIKWIILNREKFPFWLVKSLEKPNKPFSKVVEETKLYQVYIMKGIAWAFNIFGIWWFMLNVPGCGPLVDQPCRPVFGNVALLDIGGITFELTLFFILTNLYRWFTREKQE